MLGLFDGTWRLTSSSCNTPKISCCGLILLHNIGSSCWCLSQLSCWESGPNGCCSTGTDSGQLQIHNNVTPRLSNHHTCRCWLRLLAVALFLSPLAILHPYQLVFKSLWNWCMTLPNLQHGATTTPLFAISQPHNNPPRMKAFELLLLLHSTKSEIYWGTLIWNI